MTWPRRIIIAVTALTLLIGFLLFVIPHRGGSLLGTGSDRVQQWCGVQLLRIANEHLGPEVTFDRLEYQYPKTVVLHGIRLDADDVSFITAGKATIEFAAVPRPGKPVVIESVVLNLPMVRLIERRQGGLLGFSDFVSGSAGSVDDDGGSTRPGDVFAIRRIEIVDGEVRYEGLDTAPMRLDDIDLTMDADAGEAHAGWHSLHAVLTRRPVLSIDIDARIDLETAMLVLEPSTLQMTLAESQYEVLPGSLQEFLRRQDVTGELLATLSGDLPLQDGASAALDLDLQLDDAAMRIDDFAWPVESLTLAGRLAERRLDIESLNASMLGGSVQASGFYGLDDDHRMEVRFETHGVRLERFTSAGSTASQRSGAVDLDGTVRGTIGAGEPDLVGSGRIEVTDAYILGSPIVGGVASRLGFRDGAKGKDHGSARFQLLHKRIGFQEIEVVSPTFAARGEGAIRFDSTINFTFNAGPIERIQQSLGGVGDLLGKLTDKVVTYEVVGTLSSPEVKVRPFGIGKGK